MGIRLLNIIRVFIWVLFIRSCFPIMWFKNWETSQECQDSSYQEYSAVLSHPCRPVWTHSRPSPYTTISWWVGFLLNPWRGLMVVRLGRGLYLGLSCTITASTQWVECIFWAPPFLSLFLWSFYRRSTFVYFFVEFC